MKKKFSCLPFLIALVFFCSVLMNEGCMRSPYGQGKMLYQRHCQNCHMEKGEGLKALIPALNNSGHLVQIAGEMPCIIRNGVKGERLVNEIQYNNTMPGNPDLEYAEIANIINYIYYEWSDEDYYISDAKVAQAIKKCDGS